MPVRITKQLQTRIFRHLESTWPNEGGGFLLGEIAQDAATVCESIAVENVFEAAEQYHRYAMTPQDWMRLEDEADTRGLALLGYYHSHPDSPAIPSDYDREHALPNFVYLITRVQAGAAQEMLAWRLRTDRSRFDSETLEVVVD
ncbi:MAG: M67 family metallopeptidase [Anaerolineae bacterium]|nr:M67 family metallopeptidase [Anaerolineae bacterium]